ncbi:MAG: hypothetical protein VB071_12365 [Lawsonibacter sp.]|nr:hypothetical protein [Lawsonibacter sp.]
MRSLFDSNSCDLLVLAVVLAVLLAQDQDQNQIAKMAAFFTVVGDTLGLFALQPGLFTCCKEILPALDTSSKLCADDKGANQTSK